MSMNTSSPASTSERDRSRSRSSSTQIKSSPSSPLSWSLTPGSDLTAIHDSFDYPVTPYEFPMQRDPAAYSTSPSNYLNIDPSLRPVKGMKKKNTQNSPGSALNSAKTTEDKTPTSEDDDTKEHEHKWPVKKKKWGRERKFDEKLFQILGNEKNRKWVHWDKSEKAIVIPDTEAFAENVLPEYYDATQFESFVRQLYSYGFKRRAFETKGTKGTKIQNDDWYRGMTVVPRRDDGPQVASGDMPVRRSTRNISQPAHQIRTGFPVSAERGIEDEEYQDIHNMQQHMRVLEDVVEQERRRISRLQATIQEYIQAYPGSDHMLGHLEQSDLPSFLGLHTPGPSASPNMATSATFLPSTLEAVENLSQLEKAPPKTRTRGRKGTKKLI
ncbi:HSF-type DNA-binding-domain-containing protein [Naematelia encephala]|uniref:HSF-type DNA-binding-domain-containing protein n=1 Tax=Naematelia encephala TaxID=71784 RepID=A0A1Y2BM94_9TREE|nr:HSF-type DNA-binding-domain-containing protein [Naematelia encephala]